jgi:hypothetical protein
VTEILDVMWFCAGHGNVGIVRVHDQYEGRKYYIGQCSGINEDLDKNHIANWGSTFSNKAGDILFGVDDVENQAAVAIPRSKEYATAMVKVGLHYLEHGDDYKN